MSRLIDIDETGAALDWICERAKVFEARYADDLAAVHPEYRDSAKNLVHYLALRHTDLRELQEDLAILGLSSLGRAERNVMASLRAVRHALRGMGGDMRSGVADEREALELRNPSTDSHTRAILGESPAGRDARIMVTLPSEASSSPQLVSEMIAAGTDNARINCAHDSQEVWARMIDNVRTAGATLGKECRIVMDLAGPKLRTGDLEPGPQVVHIRPRRDPLGRVIAPRRIRFIPDDEIWHGTKAAVIPVTRECIELANEGDEIRLRDTRGKKRRLKVIRKDAKGLVLETYQGAYIATGTKLRLIRKEMGEKLTYRVGELPCIEQPILLRAGDTLILHADNTPGAPARENTDGEVIKPAHVSCRHPEVFEFVSAGDPIWINDGKIAGIVRSASKERLEIEIEKAKPTGSRLRADRGVNFPESDIRFRSVTASDKTDLEFIVKHADAVGLSFVRTPDDIVALQNELDKLGCTDLGLIIKIETEQGFNNLPSLLLTAMRSYPVAVMIARGDLAVECGWERLAELQEEILWLCEAARLPVIWATQVLEQETKKGQPSRAEITDAAMSQRADCVMLNKGPHILAAIRMLDNILRRMQGHQYKKMARLGKLEFSDAGLRDA